ncbi:MAG: ubiquinol-cytochrome c reductase cytochrome c1 subunit [Parasphingorhabdus sp.]|jgi:ubiquinol-cytochrome c reductase cytochrome c1 subunit
MKKALAILMMLALPVGTLASGGGNQNLDKVEIDLTDEASLQRGAKIFVNFCLSCHSASFLRYEKLVTDLGISEEIVLKDLMFAGDKIGELMTSTMPEDDAKKWFGTAPPDLSLISRSRGPDWIYTYMRSFYLDDESPSGWNNIVFPHVAMPHAMYEWQGNQRAIFTQDSKGNDKFERFELVKEAQLTPVEYDSAMRDLTNFMVYMGEPAKLVRYKYGFWVLTFLLLFIGLTYMLKKEYWRDIHGDSHH